MKQIEIKSKNLKSIYSNIKGIIEQAKNNAFKAINFAMVRAYWEIGCIIVEEEQSGQTRAKYGQFLIKELSKKLTLEFGRGFDESNLRYIRLFYINFPNRDALRHELSWTHHRLLLRVEKSNARNFYLIESIENNWSTRQLERQINSLLFERISLSKEKEEVKKIASNGQVIQKANDIIKDPYVLEFIGVKENKKFLEKDLEKMLIDKLQDFLLELGKGFSFIARQKRITIDGDHFYIDLVFYNYILKCFVLIELKTEKLTHEDIGQMDFYVRYFEKEIKTKNDNPTIGLLLCTDKNKAMVKYTLLDKNKQIFASRYKLYLPTEKELKKEIIKEKKLFEIENKFLKRK